MTKIRLKPINIKITTRRIGNRTAITTSVNGRTRTKYI